MTTEVSVRDSLSFNYSPDFCFFLKHFSHWFNCIVTIHIQSKFRWEESLSRNEISIENVCLFRKDSFHEQERRIPWRFRLLWSLQWSWPGLLWEVSQRSRWRCQPVWWRWRDFDDRSCLPGERKEWYDEWCEKRKWRERDEERKERTWMRKTPEFWKFWRSSSLVSGFAAVTSLGLLTVGGVSLTNTYVGFPAFKLAHTMCLPMAPVGPKTRILSFPAMTADQTQNKHLAVCGFLVL